MQMDLPGSHGKVLDSIRSDFPGFGWWGPHSFRWYRVREDRDPRWYFHKYSPETVASHIPNCSWSCYFGNEGSSAIGQSPGWGNKGKEKREKVTHSALLMVCNWLGPGIEQQLRREMQCWVEESVSPHDGQPWTWSMAMTANTVACSPRCFCMGCRGGELLSDDPVQTPVLIFKRTGVWSSHF